MAEEAHAPFGGLFVGEVSVGRGDDAAERVDVVGRDERREVKD